MITVEEAQKRIIETVKVSGEIRLDLSQATGHVLSKGIRSPLDLPPFDQSAMDGYAIISDDFINNKSITTSGESAAGKNFNSRIKSGQAVRIFTGAEIPKGADAVVMQEKISLNGNELVIDDGNFKGGQ